MAEQDLPRVGAPPSLKDATWLKRPETARVFAALSGEGIETRAVGGAVRNTLLGLEVAEVDLATTALPDKVMALARKVGLKAIPTGIEHGTVTVVADGVPFEVTTLRRDVETFGRHATVAFTEDWAEDARRRDFTLNALYAGSDGTLFDPLGGYDDLASGRVRFIGDPGARIEEDYLRILRFFRFNAHYGRGPLDETGLAACVRLRDGLGQLSAERIAAELKRVLIAPRAIEAIEALFVYGLLTLVLGGVPRLARFTRLTAIETALAAVPNAPLRLAALAVFVAEDAPRLAARFRLSNAEQAVLALGADDLLDTALPNEAAAKRLLYRGGPSAYVSQVLLAWATDGAAADDADWQAALTLPERWQAPAFPLRGTDLAGLGLEGPALGEMLRRLEQHWVDSGFDTPRETLLAMAGEISRRSPTQDR
ncbi:MAG: CCA tRNA nucleotidyltransferase [Methyloceanibacter sp.]|uniref:CCA tRNA nucleotidyltransferase n=1 Tax=Methyloceanibacter sp. TaxID=1965321 RepID=UPI003D6C8161